MKNNLNRKPYFWFRVALITGTVFLLAACMVRGGNETNPEAINTATLSQQQLGVPEKTTDGTNQATPSPAPETAIVQETTEVAEIQVPLPETPSVEPTVVPVPTEIDQTSVDDLPSVAPKVGFRAPDFTLETLDGNTLQLSSLTGNYIVLNYWASWCVPCKKELSILEDYHLRSQNSDLLILSVNGIEQDTLSDASEMVSALGMTFPVILDEESVIWDSYRVLFLPTTFFIDKRGIIRYIKLGEFSEAEFQELCEKLQADQL